MGIRQRGRHFQVYAYLGRVDGKDKYLTRTCYTLTEARDEELRLKQKAKLDRTGADAGTTLTQLLERWFEHAQPDLAETTVATYRSYIDRVIIPGIGKTKLYKLNAGTLDDFYGKLRRGEGSRALEVATVRQIHAIIRRACAVAVRWGWLDKNPASLASPGRLSRKAKPPPSPEAIRQFLSVIDADLALVLRVAFASGARRGELCALRWPDVDLEHGALTIARALSTRGGTGPAVEKDTKTHQIRVLALDGGTIEMLRVHRADERAKAELGRVVFDPDGFVFTTQPGKPWHPDSLGARYRRAAVKHGLKARLHDWRHASATNALGAGVPVRQVSARLGHASAAMTLDVYGHAIAPADRAAADALGALLD